MASMVLKMVCVVLACMVVATPFAEGALSCGTVASKMTPCLGYLTGKGPLAPACCAGVKGLLSSATTTADRQTACGCLKNAANSVPGISLANASGLPGKCGVNIPYKISPSTDCAKVK